jgi:serine/threonine protein phosphatase 1
MSRILAISDIHGMYDEFDALLKKVNYDPNSDKLVLLGDYVDRGPYSVKCLKKVMELERNGAVVLMGNHENMCLDILDSIERRRSKVENLDYLDESQKTVSKIYLDEDCHEIFKFMRGLKKIHKIDNFIFVHSGYNPYVDFNEQDDYTLLWSREMHFNEKIPDNNRIVFGHTPTKYLGCFFTIFQSPYRIGIDCGAVFGGNLACLIIRNGIISAEYVKCERQMI